MSSSVTFDTAAFLREFFPSATHMHGWLAEAGLRTEKAAVFKWWHRSSVPADSFAVVLALLEMDRGPISLVRFLKDAE